MKSGPAQPDGLSTSKPTWRNTPEYSSTSVFSFSQADPHLFDGRHAHLCTEPRREFLYLFKAILTGAIEPLSVTQE